MSYVAHPIGSHTQHFRRRYSIIRNVKRLASLALSAFALTALTASAADVHHRLPALSSVFPQGTEPGTKLRVEVLGEYLDRAQAVVFLDPSVRGTVVRSDYTRLDLEFDVAPEAPLGPHYFRVVSPRGPSNLLLFRIGDQPHRLEHEPNDSFEQAEEVPIPVTLNARLNADGDFDFFRFRVQQHETWVFDLRAARNGNGLDAALILLDSEGRKLAHCEDFFIWDPFLTYTFPKAGVYYAVVQPTHARLDPNFAYQLHIRKAPHLETVSPLSLPPGAAAEATIYGAGLVSGKADSKARLWFDAPGFDGEVFEMRGSSARVKIRVPADARPGPHQLALLTSGGRSDPVTFLVDAMPVHKGGEEITPPVSITGVARYRRPERFFFDAKQGQSLVFEVRAQRFGSPVDSVLRLRDEKGKEIAVNDDATFPGVQFNKDSRISQTFPQAGRYQIEMRNLSQVTGEDFPYQLLVRPPDPGFELLLATDQPYLYPGGSDSLKVTAARRDGFDATIRASVTGLPAGVTAEPAEIPAGKNDGEIRLHVGDAKPGTWSQIRVVSDPPAEPAWHSVRISSGGGEGATFARVDQATLAVAERPGFALEVEASNVNLTRAGSAEIPVEIQRSPDFHGEIRFRLENLPAGVSAEPVTAAPEAPSVTIRLRAGPGAAAGRFSRVAILGSDGEGRVQEAPRITVLVN